MSALGVGKSHYVHGRESQFRDDLHEAPTCAHVFAPITVQSIARDGLSLYRMSHLGDRRRRDRAPSRRARKCPS